jgi:hypothetical protein
MIPLFSKEGLGEIFQAIKSPCIPLYKGGLENNN